MASRVHGPVEARPFVAPPSAVEEDRRDPEVRVRAAIEEGMDSLRDDGVRKVFEGHTTIEEVLASAQDDV